MLLRSSSGCDFLVVGLGNPGSKYWNTRHNVGYAALDALAKDLGVTVDRVKFQGLTAQANLADWVLGVFPYDQREAMEEIYRRAAQAAKVLILQGPEAAANQFNRK